MHVENRPTSNGTDGFSFVIVIFAEFTTIQLGFGFTLLGVGGLIGITRTMVANAIGNVILELPGQ